MKWRSTAVLAGVALLLGVYLLAFERSMLTTDEAKERADRIWPDGDVDAVTELVVERGGVTVTMKKEGTDWHLTAPTFADLGDETEIGSILGQLEYAKAAREVGGLTDLKAYGTGAPRLIVRVTMRDGKKTSFQFGVEAPGGKHVYVQREGSNDVLLVEKTLFEALDKEPSFWRDKRLLAAARARATSYTLRGAAGESFAASLKNGFWVAGEPAPGRAADAAIDRVFTAMGDVKIEKFVDDAAADLAPYGLAAGAAPGGSASVSEAAGRVLAVRFGRAEGDGVYATREGAKGVFLVKADKVAALLASARDVRERVLFPHAPLDVKAITITRDGATLALEKETSKEGGETWKITKPKEGTADLMQVEDALRALRKLTVVDFLPPGEALSSYGLEPGLAVLEVKVGASVDLLAGDEAPGTVKPETPDRVDRLVLGKLTADGSARYAIRAEEGVVLTVPAEAWDLLAPSPLRFQDKSVVRFNKWDARELTLVRPSGTVHAVSDAGAWNVDVPIKAKGDKDGCEAVLTLLADLKADELVELDAKDGAKYGLGTPKYRVTVKTKGFEADAKEETFTVDLGGDAGGGKVYGFAPAKGIVFKIDAAKLAVLDKDLVSKKVTGLNAWEAKSLRFKTASGELELQSVDDAWRVMRPVAADANKATVDAWLKDNLEDLAAESIAPAAPTDGATYGFDAPRLVVTVGVAAGDKVFTVGAKDTPDGLVPVRAEGTATIYFLSKLAYEKLNARVEDFTGTGAPSPAPPPLLPPSPPPGLGTGAPGTAAPTAAPGAGTAAP
jgi:hypothetical protein